MTQELEVFADDGAEYPWAPQSGETTLGYAYFKTYLQLGPQRSIAWAARELEMPSKILRDLSAKFSWVERAVAFDNHLVERRVDEIARGRLQMREEHISIAQKAREKVVARLESMNPMEMTPRDASVWFDLAVKVERQARGEADKTIEVHGNIDVDGLSTADRRALMAAALETLSARMGIGNVIEGEIVEDDDDGQLEAGGLPQAEDDGAEEDPRGA
jgi:hypothetical protein